MFKYWFEKYIYSALSVRSVINKCSGALQVFNKTPVVSLLVLYCSFDIPNAVSSKQIAVRVDAAIIPPVLCLLSELTDSVDISLPEEVAA